MKSFKYILFTVSLLTFRIRRFLSSTQGIHRYYFRIYALDTTLDLRPGANKEKLETAMKGHIISKGQLVGKYGRK